MPEVMNNMDSSWVISFAKDAWNSLQHLWQNSKNFVHTLELVLSSINLLYDVHVKLNMHVYLKAKREAKVIYRSFRYPCAVAPSIMWFETVNHNHMINHNLMMQIRHVYKAMVDLNTRNLVFIMILFELSIINFMQNFVNL